MAIYVRATVKYREYSRATDPSLTWAAPELHHCKACACNLPIFAQATLNGFKTLTTQGPPGSQGRWQGPAWDASLKTSRPELIMSMTVTHNTHICDSHMPVPRDWVNCNHRSHTCVLSGRLTGELVFSSWDITSTQVNLLIIKVKLKK